MSVPQPEPTCPKRALRRRCAEVFGVDEARMIGGNRRRDIIVARHATCYVLRQRFPLFSLPRLGRLMGGRDHTTMIAAIRQTEARMARDPELAGQIHALIACPNGDPRYHDAHVRQWAAYHQASAQMAPIPAPSNFVPPIPAAMVFGGDLAEFVEAPKMWCAQCDRAVSDGERRGCSARLCSLRPAQKANVAVRLVA